MDDANSDSIVDSGGGKRVPAGRRVDAVHTFVPRWARALAVALGVLLLAHLGATALWVGPSNAAKESLRDPLTAYMQPMFQQNWSLFAPAPVSITYAVEVRGWSTDDEGDDEGDAHPTAWVDATAAEMSTLTHTLFPPRVNRVSRNLARTMRNLHVELSDAEHLVLGEHFDDGGWSDLRDRLDDVEEPSDRALIDDVLQLDRTMTAYATQVATAHWPEREFTQVQVQIVEHPAAQYGTTTEPETHHRLFGRRPLVRFDHQDEHGFADAFHRYSS